MFTYMGLFQKTTRKTPMAVANPREIPEYELNPLELQVRKADGIAKAWSYSPSISVICACNDNFFSSSVSS